jgi:hypothetical protein
VHVQNPNGECGEEAEKLSTLIWPQPAECREGADGICLMRRERERERVTFVWLDRPEANRRCLFSARLTECPALGDLFVKSNL